ncbi:threonine--tRNA ligase [Candidatus Daviesbacteria bacterium RIFCSPHIGHO2_02_FULL_36_13]|uniref:Threonine--tRNA ligase n=1 Tax=Candidatus Daviesbacteria bacterium RIFCSPHIGHO2_02_FULL_36_13 TaxID=1797768 RepID=A0A1F5JYB3_9BACT|nr:MAG: threonine--tRNA ligase [Candidatus Daviesbacteria bacterium RIFCSPHIGHO2_02_FULL_36_13]OGE42125.1 MAG: threonine--tRNA ligase [Candidatus Daviesbacteria bacterium RIFCSPLOWO2_01_FULL_36_8]
MSDLKDHKQLGQELELFFTTEIAPGAPFWLPRGMVIFKELEKYIRELTDAAGYLETSTPIMVKSKLFKESGHWDKFGEHNMYNLDLTEEEDKETVMYSLKPMNCPESTILYRFRPRSYRELPLRLSEIGRLHRREKSGEVNGLLRVRQLTMDDAHIYAREDQIFDEVSNILDMMINFYKSFGFEYEFRLATRPETRAGSDENWDKAEKELANAINKKGLKAGDKMGDGAFYGPKIDVHIKDSQGREWQLATVQLDFHQPEAFKLEYIDEKGEKQRPVMIHRAIFGSFERFIAILTEHFQGAFPTWLSPVQVMIIPISEKHLEYAQNVLEQLKGSNLRVEVDSRSESMQSKIRDAQMQKVPYMLVVGDREASENTVAVRQRSEQKQEVLKIEEFISQINKTIESKSQL